MIAEKAIQRIRALVEENRQCVLDAADYIWKNPETGFREWKTSAYLAQQFEQLGYEPVLMQGIPGFYADLDTGRPGPTLALLGEMDSIICAGHPDADPQTGAVHACGHHTQSAYLLGAAAILRDTEILSGLCGKIRFVAVPAEELIELGYRATLREQGVIKYFGGKVEFLHRGVFDGVSAAIMVHSGGSKDTSLSIYKGNNGCLAKNITYTGKAAHAAGGPSQAINALYAASMGMQAINAIRETFREENITRVHPIITEGGAAVNVIPETVRMESYVRGATPEAIVAENKKVNRALAGAALSLGARLRVSDVPGYMPLHNAPGLNDLSKSVGAAMLGEDRVDFSDDWGAGSTDMGDLSCVMPVTQPGGGGGEGIGHGEDYRIVDPQVACLDSAKYMVGMAVELLGNEGAQMERIAREYRPPFESYQAYFDFIDALYSDRDLVRYDEEAASVIW